MHGLEHAEQGEWVDACSPLLDGVEGALWAAAREYKIITAERMFLDQPGKLARSVEKLFRHLPIELAYRTFLRRRVFGTAGNPLRHGDVDGGEREHVLLCVAALVGWLEAFSDKPAAAAFGTELRSHLPPALEAPAA